ncbi:unnamed protein product [Discosporangium mesarthrocarpum]
MRLAHPIHIFPEKSAYTSSWKRVLDPRMRTWGIWLMMVSLTVLQRQFCNGWNAAGIPLSLNMSKGRRLIVFRGRSRHTFGFDPQERFELPRQEFLAAAEGVTGTSLRKNENTVLGGDRADDHFVHLKSSFGSEVFQWGESSLGDDALAQTAARCVLTHGLFECWGTGQTVQEAAADALRPGCIPSECIGATWDFSVTSYGRPEITTEEENRFLTGPLRRVLNRLKGQRKLHPQVNIHIVLLEDLCPPPPSPSQGWGGQPQRKDQPHPPSYHVGGKCLKPTMLQRQYFICRTIRMGPAVGGRGVLGSTLRRPKSGVLKLLALHNRRCKGPTAIEPEVALVMANLAKVRQGSLVLDPFCGSCSLLLPAAYLGARTVGSDISGPAAAASKQDGKPVVDSGELGSAAQVMSRENGVGDVSDAEAKELELLHSDFESLGLALPELVMADIGDNTGTSPIRRSGYYDAIIADPPYNMKERFLTANSLSNVLMGPACAQEQESSIPAWPPCSPSPLWETGVGDAAIAEAKTIVDQAVKCLWDLAVDVLKPGGRLCFFLPLRGEQARLGHFPKDTAELLCQGGLFSLRFTARQRLSSHTVCRWLVVLEKNR